MKGHIPVLTVEGQGLAEAWEKSLIQLYKKGCDIKTEYDQTNDPPSKDCTMTIIVNDPLAEPMIHKDLPGGLSDLQEYVMEVIDGIKTIVLGLRQMILKIHDGSTPTISDYSSTPFRK